MTRFMGAAVIAAASIVLVGAPAAYGATTLHVDAATGTDGPSCGASSSPCRTIQQAVDNASDGDTIQVAAGTYDETYSYGVSVYVDKSVTLEGAQAGSPGSAARASESPATESVVTGGTFDVEANGVTVDGFSFGYAGTQACVACDAFQSLSSVTIENSEFVGYEPVDFGPWYVTSAIGVYDSTDTTITRNYLTSPGSTAGAIQFFHGGCSDTVVSDNTFYAAADDGLATIFFYCLDEPSSITLSGNDDVHVGDTNGESFLVAEGVAGDIHATGNHVSASSTSGSVFWFTLSPNLGAVDVSGNSVDGTVSAGVVIRPSGGGAGTTYTITGNRLSAGKYGVYVYAGPLARGATVTLHGNILSGNSASGVYNEDTGNGGRIDATNNWWGCNGGPGASGCSGVSGVPLFDPWLVLGVSASPSTVVAPGSSTVTADVTHDSAGADASALGTIPDGTSIAFATDFGTLSASTAGTTAGKASVTLSSSAPGTANVSATLDSQTASTAVTFTLPPRPTSIDQCKKGGWQSYGVFKNQGDCVSDVATRGKNGPNG